MIADLESKNAELERFAYTVSHDLKSPLVTLKGFLGLLRNDLADGNSEAAEEDVDRLDPVVEIGCRSSDGSVVCCVKDNGMGVDPEFHEGIFGLFNQLDPEAEGSGVGLALVKRIVELHGGRIWVESAGAGSGSTFCFSLPQQKR